MEIGQTLRPKTNLPLFEVDQAEPRKKCSFCCAAWSSLVVFTIGLVLSAPGSYVTMEKRLVTWPRRLDRFLFIPLPIACVCFTHQYLMSQALWSKNKKMVWTINWQTSGMNLAMWITATFLCTRISRKYLPKKSRDYRLRLWEYQRVRRSTAQAYLPQMWGRLSVEFDYVHMLWFASIYHFLWGALTFALDKQMSAHYAMLYKSVSYSQHCSPRWREWREVQVKKHLQNEEQPMEKTSGGKRWGGVLQYSPWRLGGPSQ